MRKRQYESDQNTSGITALYALSLAQAMSAYSLAEARQTPALVDLRTLPESHLG